MTLTVKIDNPDFEEITIEALKNCIDLFHQKKKFDFKKKDPRKYSRIIKRDYNEKDVDEVALLHIKDSAKYEHDLRREKRV